MADDQQPSDNDSSERIENISLDERSLVRRSPEVEHERQVAIFDLLEANTFSPKGSFTGPYDLHLRIEENRLIFDVRDTAEQPAKRRKLSGDNGGAAAVDGTKVMALPSGPVPCNKLISEIIETLKPVRWPRVRWLVW